MEFINQFIASHPALAFACMAMAFARTINKPLFTFLHSVASATDTHADDQAIAAVEGSKIYAALCWFLDFTLSMKIGPQKPAVPAPQPVLVLADQEKTLS